MGDINTQYECITQIYPNNISLKLNNEKELDIVYELEYENDEYAYNIWKSVIQVLFIINKNKFPLPSSIKFELIKCNGCEPTQLETVISRLVKEELTEINLFSLYLEIQQFQSDNTIPSGNCCICLEPITPSVSAIQLPCYHYFHSECIDNLKASGADCVCPICRTRFSKKLRNKKEIDLTKYYAMDDDIYNPLTNTLSNYFILVKNSGITHARHVILSYFYQFSPLKATYSQDEHGWIVSFQYLEQAKSCCLTFTGKSILPDYPKMEISMYIPIQPDSGSPLKHIS
ncbi:hypothetical protein ENUP19_0229G0003 [Entamoeba nuttalli]|uniref:Zinc finger domain containing protein n=2 Tax=Entamoeba nuttalli TaxID=412467 RepID=K2HTX8_ENTNP|nr:zinc finger domain containing protein [Entamoeba nuttalli P19]EKE39590.1 zinc finger domain containing protein [Entamoeba nuttalli P19]|eukprot:XP_008858067.1 zinc finger domain containing protein [Entamoeba nuttalli P19]